MSEQSTFKKYDGSLSCVRALATISIVACHIFQYFDNGLAWWLNVGVQVFLILSGYCYSVKKIGSIIEFLKKRAVKLLCEYYIVTVLTVLAGLIFCRADIGLGDIARLLFIFGPESFVSLKHLWFIRYILICYVLLPLFQKYLDWCENKKLKLIWWLCFMAGIVLIGIIYIQHLDVSLIMCFIIGMMLKRAEAMKFHNIFYVIIVMLAIIMNCVRILYGSAIQGQLGDLLSDYSHVLLGAASFILIRSLYLLFFDADKNYSILRFSDMISYEVYLVHHIFILGAFSMYLLIDNKLLATVLIVILTMILALVLSILMKTKQNCFNKELICKDSTS